MPRTFKGYRGEGSHTVEELNACFKEQFTSEYLNRTTKAANQPNWSRLSKTDKYTFLIAHKADCNDPGKLDTFLEDRFPKEAEVEHGIYRKLTNAQRQALYWIPEETEEGIITSVCAFMSADRKLLQLTVDSILFLSALVRLKALMIPCTVLLKDLFTKEEITMENMFFLGVYRRNPANYYLKSKDGFNEKEKTKSFPLQVPTSIPDDYGAIPYALQFNEEVAKNLFQLKN